MSDQFVKRRTFPKSLKRGTGGCNPCFRPSAGASKADLAEFHAEDMKLRRARQRKLTRNALPPIKKRNDDPAWRNREFHR